MAFDTQNMFVITYFTFHLCGAEVPRGGGKQATGGR